jgi:lysophospholipase L1-like esterase
MYQTPPLSLLSTSARVGGRVVFVGVGDSITQRGHSPDGFLTLLQNWYSRRVDVVNRGYSGYNSQWIRALIEQQSQPSVDADTRRVWTRGEERQGVEGQSSSTPTVIYSLCIGANDAVLPPLSPSTRQFVSVDDFTSHVIAIVQRLRGAASNPSSRSAVILITPPHTDPHAWAVFCSVRDGTPLPPLIRSSANTARYAQAMKDIGTALNVPVIDLFTLTTPHREEEGTAEAITGTAPPSPNPYLIDGLHLSSRGNVVLFTALLQVISQQWPQLTVNHLPLDAPFHGDLSHDTFQQMFTSPHG